MSDLMAVAIIAAVPGGIAAVSSLITSIKVHGVEKGVNGMQALLIEAVRSKAYEEGRKFEKEHPSSSQ